VVGAVLVLLRDQLSGLADPDVLVVLVGVSAVLTGLLRVLGGFAAEKRLGRRWRLGGIVLGTLEAALGGVLLLRTESILTCWCRSPPPGQWQAAPCCLPRGCGCAAWYAPGGSHQARHPRVPVRPATAATANRLGGGPCRALDHRIGWSWRGYGGVRGATLPGEGLPGHGRWSARRPRAASPWPWRTDRSEAVTRSAAGGDGRPHGRTRQAGCGAGRG